MQESDGEAFIHVFVFRWVNEATEDLRERAATEIRAFLGVIPGLTAISVGPNLSDKNGGYTFGGVMMFSSRASFAAYVEHPAHQALLQWLVPLITAIELDLHAEAQHASRSK